MNNSPHRVHLLYRAFHIYNTQAQETMDETLVRTKGTIGFLGPGEIGWTVDTVGLSHPRAKSFRVRLNNYQSVLNI